MAVNNVAIEIVKGQAYIVFSPRVVVEVGKGWVLPNGEFRKAETNDVHIQACA